MILELQPDLDRSISRRFATRAGRSPRPTDHRCPRSQRIYRLSRAADAAEAKEIVLGSDSRRRPGASRRVPLARSRGHHHRARGIGRYDLLRPRIWSMDRQTQADEIRRLAAAPDVMLGSVHAVTETGSLIAASMGGSQLGPYVSGAGRVILVVGTQKIVPDLDEGFRRIDEYALPLEDARAQAAYGVHSAVNKLADHQPRDHAGPDHGRSGGRGSRVLAQRRSPREWGRGDAPFSRPSPPLAMRDGSPGMSPRAPE